ncbi:hypothetical protein STANM309S_06782 [Streptomyces tanashiensis]
MLGHSLLNAVARNGQPATGPVLRNSRRQELVLLMTPGKPAMSLERVARHLTTGTWLAVPPGRKVTGLSWLVPPTDMERSSLQGTSIPYSHHWCQGSEGRSEEGKRPRISRSQRSFPGELLELG